MPTAVDLTNTVVHLCSNEVCGREQIGRNRQTTHRRAARSGCQALVAVRVTVLKAPKTPWPEGTASFVSTPMHTGARFFLVVDGI